MMEIILCCGMNLSFRPDEYDVVEFFLPFRVFWEQPRICGILSCYVLAEVRPQLVEYFTYEL